MSKRLFVSNFPREFNDSDLRKLFGTYGKITDLYVPFNKESLKRKEFAFIEYFEENGAISARKALAGKQFKGRKLNIEFAKDKNDNDSIKPKRNVVKKKRNEPSYDINKFIKKGIPVETKVLKESSLTFDDFDLTERVKSNVKSKGYIHPTPIQENAIPLILDGKDIVGIANTGTGKTAAFLVPLLNKVITDRNTYALIVAPTRELASQIKNELYLISKDCKVYSALCIGGENIHRQMADIRKNPNFVIGTPGRLKDLINSKNLRLDKFNVVVLDEVDRMLDMGFIEDMRYILSKLKDEKESLFFSATISKEAKNLMATFLKDPVTVSVKVHETVDHIDQDVVRVKDDSKKIELLHDLLIKEDGQKVIIFGKTKRGVEKLAIQLKEKGFKASSIHGDKSQSQRQKSLDAFKKNITNILVATDVAARGLDIPDVTHVINYDLPQTYEDYVHRIGRTGRANKKGSAITFVKG